MTVAIYPGSFDPITNGHIDIATRASRLFDKLYIGVYASPQKNILFSTEERVSLAKDALADIPNITVSSAHGRVIGVSPIARHLRPRRGSAWKTGRRYRRILL